MRRDLVVLSGVLLVAVGSAHAFALWERFLGWSRARERWDIEEVALISVITVLGFAVFAWRRWRELMVTVTALAVSKRKTDMLRDVEGRFVAAFDHASIGMALLSPSGRFLSANRILCDMLALGEEHLHALDLIEIVHCDDQAAAATVLRRIVEGDEDAARLETRLLCEEGGDRWVRLNVAPVRDDRGLLTSLVAHIEDITARRDAEEALAASQEQFRQAFVSAEAGVALIAIPDGHFLRVNPAGCRMLGFSEDQLREMAIQDVIHPDDRADSIDRFSKVITGELPSSRARLRYLRSDGSTAHGLVSIAVVRDTHGEPLHVVAHVVDITHQVEAQERLTDLLQSKDQLIASVSHELRTPLTSIVGYSQLLLDGDADTPATERDDMLRTLAEQATDLNNIIEDLLVASRGELDTLTVTRVPVNLRAQVAQVVEGLHGSDTHHIRIVGHATTATGDPARVRQIIRNLISNALRYGGEDIEIRLRSDNHTTAVAISDNGHGIPASEQERIFDPFHSAHHAEGITASVGLGLTISRHLAQLMGGDLTYRYRDQRSVFDLTLPNNDAATQSREHQLTVVATPHP